MASGRGHVSGVVVAYAALLLLVPSQLIVRQLGAPGTPANLCALGALLWWTCATVGGFHRGGWSPTRLGAAIVSSCVVASYASATAAGWWAPLFAREATSDVTTLVAPGLTVVNDALATSATRGLLSFAGWIGIVLLTTDAMRSWADLERLVTWLSWMGGFVAALGIVQFFTRLDIAAFFRIPGLVANTDFGSVGDRSVLNRVSATATHPIEFGVVVAALLPLAVHHALHHGKDRRAWIPVVLLATALPMSVSRSAILTAGIALAVLMVGWDGKRRARTLVILPIGIVALRLMVPGLVGTIRSLFANVGNDPSISGRTDDYDVVFKLVPEHVWLGRGLFTFIPRFYRILDNQYLDLLLEVGVVGLVGTLVFFLLGYGAARGARLRARDPGPRDLGLSLSASIAGVVVAHATFDAWTFPMAAGTTFLLIGMAGAAWRLARQEQREAEQAAAHPVEAVSVRAR